MSVRAHFVLCLFHSCRLRESVKLTVKIVFESLRFPLLSWSKSEKLFIQRMRRIRRFMIMGRTEFAVWQALLVANSRSRARYTYTSDGTDSGVGFDRSIVSFLIWRCWCCRCGVFLVLLLPLQSLLLKKDPTVPRKGHFEPEKDSCLVVFVFTPLLVIPPSLHCNARGHSCQAHVYGWMLWTSVVVGCPFSLLVSKTTSESRGR